MLDIAVFHRFLGSLDLVFMHSSAQPPLPAYSAVNVVYGHPVVTELL